MNNTIMIKIMRATILFLIIYLSTKYLTTGKIPEKELLMISSIGVITQILLDTYRPIISIDENYEPTVNRTCGCY